FPEMTLRAAAVVPPTVLFGPPTRTPCPTLPRGEVPSAARPMTLPWISVPDEVASVWMPSEWLPEMTLPAPAAVPPMVSPLAGPARRAADGVAAGAAGDVDTIRHVAERGGAGGVGADEIARDDVAGHGRPREPDAVQAVAADDVARACDGAADGVVLRRGAGR